VRGLVDEVLRAGPDHGVCVMGDLNDTLESLPVRLLMGVDATSKLALRSTMIALPAERRVSVYHGGGASVIDHILVSERLARQRRSFAIFNEELSNHGLHVDDAPLTEDSDHALCVATFG